MHPGAIAPQVARTHRLVQLGMSAKQALTSGCSMTVRAAAGEIIIKTKRAAHLTAAAALSAAAPGPERSLRLRPVRAVPAFGARLVAVVLDVAMLVSVRRVTRQVRGAMAMHTL